SFTMTIPSVDLKDADTYTVKLDDGLTQSARLKVQEIPISVLIPLQVTPELPLVGNEFTLSVTLNREPSKKPKWLKNGKDLSLRKDARFTFKQEKNPDNNGITYTLTIRSSTPDDEGIYRFEIEPISESLNVKLTEQKILIVQCDEDVSSTIGSSITISCTLNVPQGHVTWFHDGIKIASSETPIKSTANRYTLTSEDTKRTLTIKSVEKDDFGPYTVKTKDDKRDLTLTEKTSDDDKLKVLESPPKLLDLDQNDELNLSIVTNRPCPIEWTKDNRPLNTIAKQIDDKHYRVTFTVPKVDFDHAGIYKCVVLGKNNKPLYEYQTEVLVHDPYERQKQDLEFEEPLIFVRKLEDQKVNEDTDIVLECELNRQPSSIKWFKDGNELVSNEKIEIVNEEKILQMKIRKVSVDDEAEYSVTADNLKGYAFVGVITSRVRFTQTLADTIVRVKSKVKLDCKLSIPDTPITWKRDGVTIKSDNIIYRIQMDGQNHSLEIESAELDHSGKYSAHYNDDVETSCQLSVQEEPVFSRELPPELTLKVGTNLLVDVETYRPNKKVQWYKNGELLSSMTGRFRRLDDKYGHSLKIAKVTVEDDDNCLLECVCDSVRSQCRVYVQKEPLVFIKELDDLNYTPNEKLVFTVKMNKKPSDESHWLHNDQVIVPDNRIKITYDDSEHESKLIIFSSDESDQGKYMYDAVEARTSCTANLKVTKLQFVQDLRNRTVKQDQPCQFECELNKIPTKIEWFINDQLVTSENTNGRIDIPISPDGKKYILKIKQAILNDNGKVTVKVDDELESTATLEVKRIPTEFIKGLTNARVSENETAEFSCELNKANIPVKWFLDGQLIENYDHFEIKQNGAKHSLTVRNAQWNDAGEYKCIADGVVTSATLTVKAIPVTFTLPLQEEVKNEDEQVEFVCETSKPCRVQWNHGDKRLTQSNKYDIETVENRHYLRVSKLKQLDKGWYKCSVQDAVTEAKLSIIDKSVELVTPLEDCTVTENESLTFFCELSKSDMDVAWYHNEQRLFTTSHSRIRSRQLDNRYELLIDDCEPDDQGLYEMRCEHIKTSCHLTVKRLTTTFLEQLKNIQATEEDTIRFQCRISKLSSNVKWYKDGVRLTPSDRLVYSVKNDLLTLIIHNVQMEDAGNYRCMVDDEHTDGSLLVEPLPILFTKMLPKTRILYNAEPLSLTCQLSKPNVKVTWFKDGIPLKSDDPRVQAKSEGLRYTLSIRGPTTIEDEGLYTIKIDNDDKESSCQVSVEDLADAEKKKPHIIRPLQDLTVPEGGSFSLECEFE
ncbi:unnamed protein product, partial [Didymodactylos carnosus]